MKKRFLFILIAVLGFITSARSEGDTIVTKNGQKLVINCIGHGSVAIQTEKGLVYVDPVRPYADYTKRPKADMILITHPHHDHLDTMVINTLHKDSTVIICDKNSAPDIVQHNIVVHPGESVNKYGIKIEAVPAYNTSEGKTMYHPKEAQNNGYVLTVGGTRIYIAGDTEDIPEMKNLKNIDIAFLPVNQPYTMTPDQAVNAVKTIKPKIFYPYHYGGTDQPTDMTYLQQEASKHTEVRIRNME